MLQWAHQRGGPWEDSISPSAAGGGHLDVLKWAHEVVRGEASTCTSAAQGGHLEVLKWARQQWIPWGDTFDAAVRNGHFELLQWAYGEGCQWSIHSLRLACVYTHLDIATWLHAQNYPASADLCTEVAIEGGKLGLQHLRGLGYPWHEDFYEGVARYGSLDMLQWAHGQSEPPPLRPGACVSAAFCGDLEILMWMCGLATPFPWGPEVCRAAVNRADGDGFACLKWLREQTPRCSWNAISSLELLRNEMALPGSFLPDSFGRNTGELEKFYVDAHDLARAESVSFALTPNCMGVRFPDGPGSASGTWWSEP